MSDAAQRSVLELRNHIERQVSARNAASGQQYEPSSEEKAERERLMQRLLPALGLSRAEVQSRLGIGRATWDRWRAMSSVPHRSHLEMLERLAAGDREFGAPARMPPPLYLLNRSPRTWSRLNLVFSSYDWDNAVFGYHLPFTDEKTVTEMMLLALRGCRIVYIVSKATADEWRKEYVARMIEVIGTGDAARALSKICVIDVPEKEAAELRFFIFNFEASNPDLRVGYTWTSGSTRPAEAARGVYDPRGSTDDLMHDVSLKYSKYIKEALKRIDERQLKDTWELIPPEQTQALLQLPVVEFPDEIGKVVS